MLLLIHLHSSDSRTHAHVLGILLVRECGLGCLTAVMHLSWLGRMWFLVSYSNYIV